MKHLKSRWVGFVGCTLGLLVGASIQCGAQIYTLNDGNSSVVVDLPASGMNSYKVDGINQVKNQWFYYRAGGGGIEQPIENIGPFTASQSDARTLDVAFVNSFYSARVVYTLTGGTAGTGQSSLNEAITFLNKSATPLSLSFFDYSDFDLGGVAGGQSLQFSTTSIPSARTNRFTQTLGGYSLTTSLSSGTNFPSHVEAALYDQTLSSLQDFSATTLNGVMGPVFGDVTGTFQWDVTLPANSSLTISKLISMQVPEPSALGLLALGVAAALYRRGRTR